MEATERTFETAEALGFTSLGRKQWDNLMQRQLYEAAPTVEAGHPRYFDRDDMVALFVLDHFIRLGMASAMAGRVASAVRAELQKGPADLRTLWVVSTDSGTPRRVVSREPPADLIRHEIPVEDLRRRIEQIAEERFGGRQP